MFDNWPIRFDKLRGDVYSKNQLWGSVEAMILIVRTANGAAWPKARSEERSLLR